MSHWHRFTFHANYLYDTENLIRINEGGRMGIVVIVILMTGLNLVYETNLSGSMKFKLIFYTDTVIWQMI